MPNKTAAKEVLDIQDEPRVQDSPSQDETWERDSSYLSLGGFDLNLEITGELDPNLSYRWVKNEGDRVLKLQRRGYRPVLNDMTIQVSGDISTDHDQWISKKTGRLDTGAPQESYLMATKKDFYNEDQGAKEADLAKVDDAIRGNAHAAHGKSDELDKMYQTTSVIENNANPYSK